MESITPEQIERCAAWCRHIIYVNEHGYRNSKEARLYLPELAAFAHMYLGLVDLYWIDNDPLVDNPSAGRILELATVHFWPFAQQHKEKA